MSHLCTKKHDSEFMQILGLSWLPWVGEKFSRIPPNRRLLIVGESHYVRPEKPELLKKVLSQHLGYPDFTRDVVSECLINQEWPNRTLDNIAKLLFLTDNVDRPRLWANTAFYNFVQVPMHFNESGSLQRPTWEHYVAGWTVFLGILRILRPSHCLFIGVEALNHCNRFLASNGIEFSPVQWTEQVGRTYGRKGFVKLADIESAMIGVKHLGRYFNWKKWNSYLLKYHPDLMEYLAGEHYS